MREKLDDEQIERLLSRYKFNNIENQLVRLPITREAALLSLVRQGKYREIQVKSFDELAPNLGETAKDPHKRYEYYTVCGVTLCCRAAIDGGMNPDDAYDLSDVLLQQLEQTESIEQMQQLFQLAAVTFAKAVFYSKRQSSSYVIEQCKGYIGNHIYSRITIEELGAYVGLNPKYVSRLFSQKESITIRDYIQREKVRESCNLLKYSARSVAEIAMMMGFQSQSNFGVVFRKWMGITPMEYRNQNYHETCSQGGKD